MIEYTEYRLGQLCKRFSSGKGISADRIDDTGLYPVIGGNGIRGYTDTYNFDGECAVIGRQGAYCGNVKYFSGKAYMTEHAVVTEPNKNNNAKYLAYKLDGLRLGRLSGQAAQPGLSVTKLARLRIIMPSKQYQDKVASILSSYDDIIEVNNKRIKILEKMAENLYKEWFARFHFPGHEKTKTINGLPTGWEYVSLESISAMLQRGISPEYDDDGDLMVISQKCIRQSIMDIHEARRQIKGYKQDLNLLDGDTVICSTGTGTLGRVGQVYGDFPGTTFDSHVTLVRAKAGISKHFLFWTLKAREYWFMNMGIGSTNQQELYKKTIQNTKVLLPEQKTMMDFERIIEPIHQEIVKIMQNQENLIMQRNLLLPRLMSGKLAV